MRHITPSVLFAIALGLPSAALPAEHANPVTLSVSFVSKGDTYDLASFSASGVLKDHEWKPSWRQAFAFTNEDIKQAFRDLVGKEPESVHYGADPWHYKKDHDISNVHMVMNAVGANITSASVKSVNGSTELVENPEPNPVTDTPTMQLSEQNTASYGWTTSKSLTLSNAVKVKADVEGGSLEDDFTITASGTWGESYSHSISSGVNNTYPDQFIVQANSCALASIIVTENQIELDINYEGALSGHVLGYYGSDGYKGKIFHVFPIAQLMERINKANTTAPVQTGTFGFYTNAISKAGKSHPLGSKYCKRHEEG